MSNTLDAAKFSDLNFTDCNLAAKWATVAWHSEDIGINLTIGMIQNGLAGYFNGHDVLAPDDGELIHWAVSWDNTSVSSQAGSQAGKINKGIQYIANGPNELANIIWNYVHEECMDTACPMLGWQGVPDLAGRGVSPISMNQFRHANKSVDARQLLHPGRTGDLLRHRPAHAPRQLHHKQDRSDEQAVPLRTRHTALRQSFFERFDPVRDGDAVGSFVRLPQASPRSPRGSRILEPEMDVLPVDIHHYTSVSAGNLHLGLATSSPRTGRSLDGIVCLWNPGLVTLACHYARSAELRVVRRKIALLVL
jgi:hypothetical protein